MDDRWSETDGGDEPVMLDPTERRDIGDFLAVPMVELLLRIDGV